MHVAEPARWARVHELSNALRSFLIGSRPALELHAADLTEVLGTERSLAYGVSEIGDRLNLRFLYMHGGGDVEHSRATLDAWLQTWPSRTRFGAYNAVRPEPAQQNRVIVPRTLVPNGTPVAHALHARVGIEFHRQLRVLVCERGRLLAWVGALQLDPFTAFQHRALAALIPSLRARLSLERKLSRAALADAGLDAAVESLSDPALLVSARGEVEHANRAARALLSKDRRRTHMAIAAAIAGAPSEFDAIPCRVPGLALHYLAIERKSSRPDAARISVAARRWRLTDRQSEVFVLMLNGLGDRTIADRLGCSPSTVEKHVAAIYDKLPIDERTRAAALAAFAGFERAEFPKGRRE